MTSSCPSTHSNIMSEDDAQQLIHKLLVQGLSRRLSHSRWLCLLHQLVRRIEAALSSDDKAETSSLAASFAAGCLVQHILSQPVIDPLLIEYLQALIYGSADRSGVTPDQGPVADVITVTLHLLANVEAIPSNVPAIETVSSIIGQGLLMTFQAPLPFRVSNPPFLTVLQHLFFKAASDNAGSPSSSPPTEISSRHKESAIAPAALAFIVSNLRLLALAADSAISSPQNLLAPRVAITVLINVGQNLLGHVIQGLSAAQAPKEARAKPQPDILQLTRSMSKTSLTEVEAVLQSMNPAWKDEIALLRSLTSQISVIDQISETLIGTTSAKAPVKGGKRKAETMQDAQRRATWDHFLDVTTVAVTEKPPVEPEMALLVHLLVDQHVSWDIKLDAVKTLFVARRNAAAPSLTLEKSLTAYYFELLVAAIDACATVVETPPAFKGAEVYSALWRNALCGMIPEIVLQLEQWLDVHQHLPLRGQRLEPPHVRLEDALRAALLVMAERFNVCEGATVTQSATHNNGVGPEAAGVNRDMMADVVGLDTPPSQPIKAWLLRACIEHSLARPEAIADEFPGGHKLASEVQSLTQSLRMDAQLEGLALSTLFETRVSTDDPIELLHRVASDPGTHFIFARQLVLQMQGWLEQRDLESIARWCKTLSEDTTEGGAMLDTVMLYIDPVQLVDPLASILDRQDVGQTSDEPSTLSNILLFVQLLCYRYAVPACRISRYSVHNQDVDMDGTTGQQQDTARSAPPFLATYLTTSSVCYPLSALSEDERGLVGRWIHALFGNEGISDDLISASPPSTLLRLSPLLFSQSISACQYGLIDLETLRGGLSYFLQDLLSFALPGALTWLLNEISRVPLQTVMDFLAESGLQANVVDVPSSDGTLANGLRRNANSRTVHLEVLALLVDTDACPGSVRQLIAKAFNAFVSAVGTSGMGGKMQLEAGCETFNLSSLQERMESAGATAPLLSINAGGGWLRTLASQSHGDSRLISLLCSSTPQNMDRLTHSLSAAGVEGRAEEKALAAWLCLIAPSHNYSMHPVLEFVEKLDLMRLGEDAIESGFRTTGLVLGLVHAAGTVRATASIETPQEDAAKTILALSSSVTGRMGSGETIKNATSAASGASESIGADLFDDEPSTPPLPPTTGTTTVADTTNARPASSTSVGATSVAALLSTRNFNVTTMQIVDLLALKLLRLKSALRHDKVHGLKWSVVEEAVLDTVADGGMVREAAGRGGEAEVDGTGLARFIAALSSSSS